MTTRSYFILYKLPIKLDNIIESNFQSDETRKDENNRIQEKEISKNENKEEIFGPNSDPGSSPGKQHEQDNGDFDDENKNETRHKEVKEEKTQMSKEELVYRREGDRATAIMFITRHNTF